MTAALNPLDPAFRADPYPTLAALLEEAPVHGVEGGPWLVAGYAAVDQLLRDRGARVNEGPADTLSFPHGTVTDRLMRKWLLLRNEPDHRRIRRAARDPFLPRSVAGGRLLVQHVIDELLAEIEPRESFDLMRDFAAQLPARVMCELLAVPEADRSALTSWTTDFAPAVDIAATPEGAAAAELAARRFEDYVESLVNERRRAPGDDLCTHLLSEVHAGRLDESELVANIVLLFAAGQHTTSSLVGNAVMALAGHPEQELWLRANSDRMSGAIDEFLRYDSPVQMTLRVLSEPVSVAGETIDAGESVVLLLGAANRDPTVFADPRDLRLDRDESKPLSFGAGPHFCLGAALARQEAELALCSLLWATSEMTIDLEGVVRSGAITLRGATSVPVHVTWSP